MKFSILLQHEETGRIVERVFSFADIFNGTAKDEIDKLKRYAVIARREHINLHDKNGKEIYEGDILGADWQDRRYPIHPIGPVKWDEENARWDLGEGGSPKVDAQYHFEIIGNIYETPELIEGVAQ